MQEVKHKYPIENILPQLSESFLRITNPIFRSVDLGFALTFYGIKVVKIIDNLKIIERKERAYPIVTHWARFNFEKSNEVHIAEMISRVKKEQVNEQN